MSDAINPVMEDLAHGASQTPVSASTERMVTSYLTHELRAPLTSIRSALTLLEENLAGSLKPDQNQLLALAIKNSERLSFLINDILDYQRIQSGKMQLYPSAVSPQSLIIEAIESMSAWAISKRIKLLRMPEIEPLPRVWADPQRVIQVLINLLANAIKFTPSGGRIEVAAAAGKGASADMAEFTVKDTGCGIVPGDLERIFDCFQQAAAGARHGGGTGLGLTLSKAMVELQGGRIWANSGRGLGSVFHFTVPISLNSLDGTPEIDSEDAQHPRLFSTALRRLNRLLATFV